MTQTLPMDTPDGNSTPRTPRTANTAASRAYVDVESMRACLEQAMQHMNASQAALEKKHAVESLLASPRSSPLSPSVSASMQADSNLGTQPASSNVHFHDTFQSISRYEQHASVDVREAQQTYGNFRSLPTSQWPWPDTQLDIPSSNSNRDATVYSSPPMSASDVPLGGVVVVVGARRASQDVPDLTKPPIEGKWVTFESEGGANIEIGFEASLRSFGRPSKDTFKTSGIEPIAENTTQQEPDMYDRMYTVLTAGFCTGSISNSRQSSPRALRVDNLTTGNPFAACDFKAVPALNEHMWHSVHDTKLCSIPSDRTSNSQPDILISSSRTTQNQLTWTDSESASAGMYPSGSVHLVPGTQLVSGVQQSAQQDSVHLPNQLYMSFVDNDLLPLDDSFKAGSSSNQLHFATSSALQSDDEGASPRPRSTSRPIPGNTDHAVFGTLSSAASSLEVPGTPQSQPLGHRPSDFATFNPFLHHSQLQVEEDISFSSLARGDMTKRGVRRTAASHDGQGSGNKPIRQTTSEGSDDFNPNIDFEDEICRQAALLAQGIQSGQVEVRSPMTAPAKLQSYTASMRCAENEGREGDGYGAQKSEAPHQPAASPLARLLFGDSSDEDSDAGDCKSVQLSSNSGNNLARVFPVTGQSNTGDTPTMHINGLFSGNVWRESEVALAPATMISNANQAAVHTADAYAMVNAGRSSTPPSGQGSESGVSLETQHPSLVMPSYTRALNQGVVLGMADHHTVGETAVTGGMQSSSTQPAAAIESYSRTSTSSELASQLGHAMHRGDSDDVMNSSAEVEGASADASDVETSSNDVRPVPFAEWLRANAAELQLSATEGEPALLQESNLANAAHIPESYAVAQQEVDAASSPARLSPSQSQSHVNALDQASTRAAATCEDPKQEDKCEPSNLWWPIGDVKESIALPAGRQTTPDVLMGSRSLPGHGLIAFSGTYPAFVDISMLVKHVYRMSRTRQTQDDFQQTTTTWLATTLKETAIDPQAVMRMCKSRSSPGHYLHFSDSRVVQKHPDSSVQDVEMLKRHSSSSVSDRLSSAQVLPFVGAAPWQHSTAGSDASQSTIQGDAAVEPQLASIQTQVLEQLQTVAQQLEELQGSCSETDLPGSSSLGNTESVDQAQWQELNSMLQSLKSDVESLSRVALSDTSASVIDSSAGGASLTSNDSLTLSHKSEFSAHTTMALFGNFNRWMQSLASMREGKFSTLRGPRLTDPTAGSQYPAPLLTAGSATPSEIKAASLPSASKKRLIPRYQVVPEPQHTQQLSLILAGNPLFQLYRLSNESSDMSVGSAARDYSVARMSSGNTLGGSQGSSAGVLRTSATASPAHQRPLFASLAGGIPVPTRNVMVATPNPLYGTRSTASSFAGRSSRYSNGGDSPGGYHDQQPLYMPEVGLVFVPRARYDARSSISVQSMRSSCANSLTSGGSPSTIAYQMKDFGTFGTSYGGSSLTAIDAASVGYSRTSASSMTMSHEGMGMYGPMQDAPNSRSLNETDPHVLHALRDLIFKADNVLYRLSQDTIPSVAQGMHSNGGFQAASVQTATLPLSSPEQDMHSTKRCGEEDVHMDSPVAVSDSQTISKAKTHMQEPSVFSFDLPRPASITGTTMQTVNKMTDKLGRRYSTPVSYFSHLQGPVTPLFGSEQSHAALASVQAAAPNQSSMGALTKESAADVPGTTAQPPAAPLLPVHQGSCGGFVTARCVETQPQQQPDMNHTRDVSPSVAHMMQFACISGAQDAMRVQGTGRQQALSAPNLVLPAPESQQGAVVSASKSQPGSPGLQRLVSKEALLTSAAAFVELLDVATATDVCSTMSSLNGASPLGMSEVLPHMLSGGQLPFAQLLPGSLRRSFEIARSTLLGSAHRDALSMPGTAVPPCMDPTSQAEAAVPLIAMQTASIPATISSPSDGIVSAATQVLATAAAAVQSNCGHDVTVMPETNSVNTLVPSSSAGTRETNMGPCHSDEVATDCHQSSPTDVVGFSTAAPTDVGEIGDVQGSTRTADVSCGGNAECMHTSCAQVHAAVAAEPRLDVAVHDGGSKNSSTGGASSAGTSDSGEVLLFMDSVEIGDIEVAEEDVDKVMQAMDQQLPARMIPSRLCDKTPDSIISRELNAIEAEATHAQELSMNLIQRARDACVRQTLTTVVAAAVSETSSKATDNAEEQAAPAELKSADVGSMDVGCKPQALISKSKIPSPSPAAKMSASPVQGNSRIPTPAGSTTATPASSPRLMQSTTTEVAASAMVSAVRFVAFQHAQTVATAQPEPAFGRADGVHKSETTMPEGAHEAQVEARLSTVGTVAAILGITTDVPAVTQTAAPSAASDSVCIPSKVNTDRACHASDHHIAGVDAAPAHASGNESVSSCVKAAPSASAMPPACSFIPTAASNLQDQHCRVGPNTGNARCTVATPGSTTGGSIADPRISFVSASSTEVGMRTPHPSAECHGAAPDTAKGSIEAKVIEAMQRAVQALSTSYGKRVSMNSLDTGNAAVQPGNSSAALPEDIATELHAALGESGSCSSLRASTDMNNKKAARVSSEAVGGGVGCEVSVSSLITPAKSPLVAVFKADGAVPESVNSPRAILPATLSVPTTPRDGDNLSPSKTPTSSSNLATPRGGTQGPPSTPVTPRSSVFVVNTALLAAVASPPPGQHASTPSTPAARDASSQSAVSKQASKPASPRPCTTTNTPRGAKAPYASTAHSAGHSKAHASAKSPSKSLRDSHETFQGKGLEHGDDHQDASVTSSPCSTLQVMRQRFDEADPLWVHTDTDSDAVAMDINAAGRTDSRAGKTCQDNVDDDERDDADSAWLKSTPQHAGEKAETGDAADDGVCTSNINPRLPQVSNQQRVTSSRSLPPVRKSSKWLSSAPESFPEPIPEEGSAQSFDMQAAEPAQCSTHSTAARAPGRRSPPFVPPPGRASPNGAAVKGLSNALPVRRQSGAGRSQAEPTTTYARQQHLYHITLQIAAEKPASGGGGVTHGVSGDDGQPGHVASSADQAAGLHHPGSNAADTLTWLHVNQLLPQRSISGAAGYIGTASAISHLVRILTSQCPNPVTPPPSLNTSDAGGAAQSNEGVKDTDMKGALASVVEMKDAGCAAQEAGDAEAYRTCLQAWKPNLEHLPHQGGPLQDSVDSAIDSASAALNKDVATTRRRTTSDALGINTAGTAARTAGCLSGPKSFRATSETVVNAQKTSPGVPGNAGVDGGASDRLSRATDEELVDLGNRLLGQILSQIPDTSSTGNASKPVSCGPPPPNVQQFCKKQLAMAIAASRRTTADAQVEPQAPAVSASQPRDVTVATQAADVQADVFQFSSSSCYHDVQSVGGAPFNMISSQSANIDTGGVADDTGSAAVLSSSPQRADMGVQTRWKVKPKSKTTDNAPVVQKV